MSIDPQPIGKLELGQFSVSYEDLPVMEDVKDHIDGQMYRSTHHRSCVFIYRSSRGDFDCFVRG